jgi:FKBP-type peptidyl-prolyl cis-trans isomerase
MKGIKFITFTIPLIAIVLFFMYSPRSNRNVRYEGTQGEVKTLYVSNEYTLCDDDTDCLLVKEDPEANYSEFNQDIEGFEYSEGVVYELQVLETNEGKFILQNIISMINPNESKLQNEAEFPKATREDITALETEILSEGTGEAVVKPTDTLTANYRGWQASNGEVFDSSFNGGSSAGIQFSLSGVIAGWQQGVPGMKVGEVRRIYIPSELAYGESGNGSIPPNADLIFDVEVMSIDPV